MRVILAKDTARKEARHDAYGIANREYIKRGEEGARRLDHIKRQKVLFVMNMKDEKSAKKCEKSIDKIKYV